MNNGQTEAKHNLVAESDHPAAGATVPRRDILLSAGAALAFTVLPRHVLGGQAGLAPSDRLDIAGVGIGAMGGNYLQNCETENIVTLADVDESFAAGTVKRYPKASLYKDYRVMLEKEKGIDAVVIGTPDHMHAFVAMAAIRLGKHVYCAKPMCRTVYETRQVTRAAREAKVATQMSTQSAASEAACATAEILQAGIIGNVREVHMSTDRPIWPQGLARPTETPLVPPNLDWNLWIGSAPMRPYHPVYHPFNWRGWYDFGTGALGDMALHAWHVFWNALRLTYPTKISSSLALATEIVPPAAGGTRLGARKIKYPESFPHAEIITFEFPARGSMPPLRLFWYDGGLRPPRPEGLDVSQSAPSEFYVGDKGVLFSVRGGGGGAATSRGGAARGQAQAAGGQSRGDLAQTGGAPLQGRGENARSGAPAPSPAAEPATRFMLLVDGKEQAFTPPPKTIARTIGHYQEWIAAAKGGKPANCNFDYACLFAETSLLGVIAARTGRDLV